MDKYLFNRIKALDKLEGDWHTKLPDLAWFVETVRQKFSARSHTGQDVYFYTEQEIGRLVEKHVDSHNWQGMSELYQSLETDNLQQRGMCPDDLELSLRVFGLNFEETWLAAYWLKNFLRLVIVAKKQQQPDVKAELKTLAEALAADDVELTVKQGGRVLFSTSNCSVLNALCELTKSAARRRKDFDIDLDDKAENLDLISLRHYFAEIFQTYVNKNDISLAERRQRRDELLLQWTQQHKGDGARVPDVSCATMNIVVKMMVLTRLILDSKSHTAAEYFNDYKLAKSTMKVKREYLKTDLFLLYDRSQSEILRDALREIYPDESELEAIVQSLLRAND